MSNLPVVLVADSHDITRAGLTSLLTSLDIHVVQATDGAAAIRELQARSVDIMVFDHAMSPVGGFDTVRYIQGAGLDIPCILMAQDRTSDMLVYAGQLGIKHILSKPVDPNRLQSIVQQILARKRKDRAPATMSIVNNPQRMTPQDYMRYAIELARKNVRNGTGGPFASVVADPNGYLIGEGTNLASSRFDPIAHAEVMAIRKATEYLQQTHLEGCSIYSTSEPTKLAKALIESVGIVKMHYGLTHADVLGLKYTDNASPKIRTVETELLCQNEVLAMLQECGTPIENGKIAQ